MNRELSKLTDGEKNWIWAYKQCESDLLYDYIEGRINNRLARLEMAYFNDAGVERITAAGSYRYCYDEDEFLTPTMDDERDHNCRPSCYLDCPECGRRLNIYMGTLTWYKCHNPLCEWNIWTLVEFWRKNRKLFTIGYGGRFPEQLVQVLQKNNINVVIDVRREHAKSYLSKYHASYIGGVFWNVNIGYEHWSFYGNYYDTLGQYQVWLDSLSGEDLIKLNNLVERIREENGNVCLLCSEKDAKKCHRSILAKRLVEWLGGNWEVVDL